MGEWVDEQINEGVNTMGDKNPPNKSCYKEGQVWKAFMGREELGSK